MKFINANLTRAIARNVGWWASSIETADMWHAKFLTLDECDFSTQIQFLDERIEACQQLAIDSAFAGNDMQIEEWMKIAEEIRGFKMRLIVLNF